MRSATLAATLLAALLAAPAPAQAQIPPAAGQVTFDNPLIGAEGCSSTATPQHTVRMSWLDQGTGAGTSGVFKIVATNTAPTAGQACSLFDIPTAVPPVRSAQVGSDIPNVGTQLSGVADAVSTSEIATKAGYGACTQDGVPVYVCVQFYPIDLLTGAPSTTATAFAFGTMTLSLATPSAVVLDRVLPGNGALNVYWTDNASTKAAKYKIRALSLLDPAVLPTAGDFGPSSTYSAFDPRDPAPHETAFVTGASYRMTGLVNFVPYAVSVIAYSSAETPSDPSNVVSSAPEPVLDFWNGYKAAGGREAGGCASGVAGPIGLGILLATLALVRRRK